MKRGQAVTIRLPNEWEEETEVQAEYLGHGTFARCYRVENEVYSFVKYGDKETDYSKQAVALYADQNNPHIPKIQKAGSFNGDAGEIYRMPFYNRLTAKHKEAYKLYKILNTHFVSLNNGDFSSVQALIPASLYEALESIKFAVQNYGDNYLFEFQKCNLAVDDSGNLILLDIAFNYDAVREIRRKSIARQEAREELRQRIGIMPC